MAELILSFLEERFRPGTTLNPCRPLLEDWRVISLDTMERILKLQNMFPNKIPAIKITASKMGRYIFLFTLLNNFICVYRYMYDFNVGPAEKIQSFMVAVLLCKNNPLYPRLDDQFGAFHAGRGRNIQGGPFATVI